jgi:hypothetical protein
MLYKYVPAARLDILTAGSVRFTQPRALNDPFEGAPLIDLGSDLAEALSMIDHDAQEFWNGRDPEEKTEENRKQFEAQVEELKLDARKQMAPAATGLGLMDRLNDALGILSLSRTPSSLLLWSHYADSHRGFVIGFDENNEFFRQKNYAGFSTFPRLVNYTSQRSLTSLSDPNYYERLLCEKPVEWAYEEEVRVFRTLGENTVTEFQDAAGFPIHLVKFPLECVNTIFVGAQASESLYSEIVRVTSAWQAAPRVQKVKMSERYYVLEFT